jgi:hypothetical protein
MRSLPEQLSETAFEAEQEYARYSVAEIIEQVRLLEILNVILLSINE